MKIGSVARRYDTVSFPGDFNFT